MGGRKKRKRVVRNCTQRKAFAFSGTNKEFIVSFGDKPLKRPRSIFPSNGIKLTIPPIKRPAPVKAASIPNCPQ